MRCCQMVFGAIMLLTVGLVPSAHAKIAVGDALPAVSLLNWEGRAVRLEELRGKVVIIDFWASWCATCRRALPELEEISKRYATAGLVVVGVNVDQARSRADQFLTERLPHPTMLLLSDPDGELLARFGAQGMPALYLIDQKGIVKLAVAGYEPERLKAVEAAVRELLGKQ
jgi:thiol-disulfide isomerase/thioredoxin